MGQRDPLNKPVVLVVEDEPLLRMLAVDLVEEAGLESREAAGASEAIKILEACPQVRVVFTDIDMPGDLNGLELAAIVRERRPRTSIILTSGKPLPRGADIPDGGVFFAKPYSAEAIIATLRRFSSCY